MLCLVTKATAKVNLFFELTNIFSFFLQYYINPSKFEAIKKPFMVVFFIFASMNEKFTGIVLRTIKHNDNLMIADIYTQQRGRLSFLLPVTRSKNSKVRNVLFQPLSIVSFTVSGRVLKQLARISDASPHLLYSTIPYDVVKSSIALYLAEVLTYALREESKDEVLFAFLERALTWFDATDEGYADFHLVFMSQLLHFLGIFPNIENWSRNSYFDMEAGTLVREHPLHSHFLMPAITEYFVKLLSHDFLSVRTMALNKELRGLFLTALEEYYGLHIPSFPRLRSAEVLRTIFSV